MREAHVVSSRTARRAALAAVAGLAGALAALPADEARAQARDQAEITINKAPGGYGAYGPNLPGVYMAQTTGVAPTPEPGSPSPAYSWVDPMPELTYEASPVGWVDGWHGNVGPGIPIP